MYKLLLSMIFVASVSAEIIGGVAIVVKGEAITLYELKEEMLKSNVNVENASNILIRKKLEELEIKNRNIKINSSDVYEEIKRTASRNNMSVNDFYNATLNAKGISSTKLKEKVKYNLERKRLYASISNAKIDEPTELEIKDYYNLHKNSFSNIESFNTVIYQSNDKDLLIKKIQYPMFNSSSISSNEQILMYNNISPKLANLLKTTSKNNFTPIIPNGKGGFMCFYIKNIQTENEVSLKEVENQIVSLINAKKREQVLSDYFARLRVNASVNVIRLPQ